MSIWPSDRERLLAISDLHVGHPENRTLLERMRPAHAGDWLIVCGDVSEALEDVQGALGLLSERFTKVTWTSGNHDLWTTPKEDPGLRGERRYARLLEICRGLGVLTPEDPYPIWQGLGGPLTVAPVDAP